MVWRVEIEINNLKEIQQDLKIGRLTRERYCDKVELCCREILLALEKEKIHGDTKKKYESDRV